MRSFIEVDESDRIVDFLEVLVGWLLNRVVAMISRGETVPL